MQSKAELSPNVKQITLDRVFNPVQAAKEGPALIAILQTLSLVRVTEEAHDISKGSAGSPSTVLLASPSPELALGQRRRTCLTRDSPCHSRFEAGCDNEAGLC
jgi:hypothetical protein